MLTDCIVNVDNFVEFQVDRTAIKMVVASKDPLHLPFQPRNGVLKGFLSISGSKVKHVPSWICNLERLDVFFSLAPVSQRTLYIKPRLGGSDALMGVDELQQPFDLKMLIATRVRTTRRFPCRGPPSRGCRPAQFTPWACACPLPVETS